MQITSYEFSCTEIEIASYFLANTEFKHLIDIAFLRIYRKIQVGWICIFFFDKGYSNIRVEQLP